MDNKIIESIGKLYCDNSIMSRQVFCSSKMENKVFTYPDKRFYDVYLLERDGSSERLSRLCYFDKIVMDALYTIYISGNPTVKIKFRLRHLNSLITGRYGVNFTGKKKENLAESLSRLKSYTIWLYLNNHGEFKERKPDIKGPLIELEEEKGVFQIKEKPVLLAYLDLLNKNKLLSENTDHRMSKNIQLIHMPLIAMGYNPDGSDRMKKRAAVTEDMVMFKHFLYLRVAQAYRKGNMREISVLRLLSAVKGEEWLGSASEIQRASAAEKLCAVLDYYYENGLIKGYGYNRRLEKIKLIIKRGDYSPDGEDWKWVFTEPLTEKAPGSADECKWEKRQGKTEPNASSLVREIARISSAVRSFGRKLSGVSDEVLLSEKVVAALEDYYAELQKAAVLLRERKTASGAVPDKPAEDLPEEKAPDGVRTYSEEALDDSEEKEAKNPLRVFIEDISDTVNVTGLFNLLDTLSKYAGVYPVEVAALVQAMLSSKQNEIVREVLSPLAEARDRGDIGALSKEIETINESQDELSAYDLTFDTRTLKQFYVILSFIKTL